MSTSVQWIPEGTDRAHASAARAYDYLLGGSHHFEADRALGDQVLSVLPRTSWPGRTGTCSGAWCAT